MIRLFILLLVVFLSACASKKGETNHISNFFGRLNDDISSSIDGLDLPKFKNGTRKTKIKRQLMNGQFVIISETKNQLIVKSKRKRYQHVTVTYNFVEDFLNNVNTDVEVAVKKIKSAYKVPYMPLVREQQQEVLAREAIAKIENSMLPIQGGSFVIGCINYDCECDKNEKPAHERKINSFKIMKHEVTWDIYGPCILAGVCPDFRKFSKSESNVPVVNVSWDDIVQRYIPWLNKFGNKHYRLPSEAEWEYAARAGTKTIFSWGDEPSGQYANGSQKGGWPDDGFENRAAPVMTFKPNMFGLYDMSGNVWEWVQDCWHDDEYQSLPLTGKPNNKRGECKRRVLRGGSWSYKSYFLRNSMRYLSYTDSRFGMYGFRLVTSELK